MKMTLGATESHLQDALGEMEASSSRRAWSLWRRSGRAKVHAAIPCLTEISPVKLEEVEIHPRAFTFVRLRLGNVFKPFCELES